MSRRDELADAAIQVVAGRGLKGLTHRAVDTQAAVPLGTASNYYRRRQDLLDAVSRRLEERDLEIWAGLGPPPQSVEGFLNGLVEYATSLANDHPQLLSTRLALFLDVPDRFSPGHHRFLQAIADALAAFGVPDPQGTGTRIIDLLDGALLHTVTVRRGSPLSAELLLPGVRALCGVSE